jgi:hypothetical protein
VNRPVSLGQTSGDSPRLNFTSGGESDVRFEEEADAEYRVAGRWYEDHRQHLRVEIFDDVDATIDQIVMLPDAGSPVPRMPVDLPV